jgi:hypothetical protein
MLTKKKTCEVAIHFNASPHHLSDFSFICIEYIISLENLDRILLNREAYWCSQLFTWQPHGLNRDLKLPWTATDRTANVAEGAWVETTVFAREK